MSANDDDYLSDKFLVDSNASSSTPRTYSQLRKQAQSKSQLKNERNRTKSRREIELESRESGLSRSLFERAKEEEASGIGSGNKALSIMMKMGFKPGQSLGKTGDQDEPHAVSSTLKEKDRSPAIEETLTHQGCSSHTIHKTEPLPLQEWAGKKGIGLGKRAPSPSTAERLTKMAKMADEGKHRDFRERTRDEYNNRRAEGRLGPTQLTCRTLDERMGKSFNVLWLSPGNDDTFPPGLIEALHNNGVMSYQEDPTETVQSRMRKQMQADALKNEDEESALDSSVPPELFPPELLEETTQFLRLQAQDRLQLVLTYLRDKHAYCFWCGIEYGSIDDMLSQCPGPEEEAHD